MLEKSLGHGSGDSTSCAALFLIYFFPRRPCLSTISKVAFAGCRREEESKREERVMSGAQPFKVRITPFRMSKGIMAPLSPIYLAVILEFMTDANESF